MSNPVDFDALDTALDRAQAAVGASESHGILCGMVCSTGHLDRSALLASVFDQEAVGQDVLVQEAAALLDQLGEQTLRQLYEGQLGFRLLLPDDDASVHERAEAVSEWCQGFLLGFGAGGLDQSKLSDELRELIADFVEITKVDAQESDEDERGEDALMNIVEYVRVGVLVIFEGLHPQSDQRPEPLH